MTKPPKPTPRPASPRPPTAFEKAIADMRQPTHTFQPVSVRWLLTALGIAVSAALVCFWLSLCLLYWQGSWQLLYHPKTEITRTPASVGLPFETIHFAATETGTPQLTGWSISPANSSIDSRPWVLYIHGADGNLSDSVDTLAALHRQDLYVFAFDYRGYGQSQPITTAGHPSEKKLLQDAESALDYLTQTFHVPLNHIVVYGDSLGATIATELAANHSSLAGVILAQPPADAMAPVFADKRSHLVPAHLLVSDRYDLAAASAALHIPSLWLLPQPPPAQPATPPPAYNSIATSKSLAWLKPPLESDPNFPETLRRWVDDLPNPTK